MAFFMMRKYILLLVLISFVLTNIVAFLDEGIRTFVYLSRLSDWVALILYTTVFLILPLLIFLLVKKKAKRRFVVSLLGFTPGILLIVLQLL